MKTNQFPNRMGDLSFAAGIVLVSALVSLRCTSPPDALQRYDFELSSDLTIEVAAGSDLVDYPMFITVDETGRLFVFESTGDVYEKTADAIENPQFRIKLLEDLDRDGVYDRSTVFADNVGFPQGGVFFEGSLYASSAPDLLKLTDTNGDGVADKREVLLSGWTLNINANSLIGPFMAPDGWLYLTSAIEGFDVETKEGRQLKGETARVWRLRPDGSNLEWVSAGGMNNPVGLTFTATSEPLGTMTYFTEPSAGYRDALIYWTEGGVYPKPNNNIKRDSLPLTGDLLPVVSKYSRVAPAGLTRYRNSTLGDEYHNNLFSSQFNTHRIIRHKLRREGGSFIAEEDVFLSTKNEDFHPTDVQEDGDGSLLVVETGGWFLKGCPLSQVSKPELKGSIYRIRKKGAPRVNNPFGEDIDWRTIAVDSMVSYLADSRPFVRNRAASVIVTRNEAVAPLVRLIKTSKSSQVRVRATFVLYRIGSPQSIAAATQSLADTDPEVRVAAARVAGLAKDTSAIATLGNMVIADEPACKRQAATALGQIGERRAIPYLLSGAENASDRFVEHAITYSLIVLNDPQMVIAGLSRPSSQVRRVALIALDQMDAAPHRADLIMPYILSDDRILRETSLWIASHHPEWAPKISKLLDARLSKPVPDDSDKLQLEQILIPYGAEPSIQKLLADRMINASSEKKIFIMNIMSECHLAKFPLAWSARLSDELLNNPDADVKMKALSLSRLYPGSGLDAPVKRLAADKNISPALRMQALASLINDSTVVTDAQFDFLYDQIQPQVAAPLRQQAASIMAQGILKPTQVDILASRFLPEADAFILHRIIPAFRHNQDPGTGRALLAALSKSTALDNFSESSIRETFKSYPAELNGSIEELLKKLNQVHAGRLANIKRIEQNITRGDLDNGRRLFFGKAICSSCHTLGSEGGHLGPDLTSIQRDRSVHDLLEAVVYPGASFVREYETYHVKTKSGTYTGVIREQNGSMVLLNISPQETVQISTSDIVSMEILDVSMMPGGFDELLSEDELADLMAFLLAQDQDPETDAKILR